MALLFLDSFDHYTASPDKYTLDYGSTSIVPGRHGMGSNGAQSEIALTPASARCIVGGAWHVEWHAGTFFYVNATGNLNAILNLGHHRDGALEITMAGWSGLARSAADVIKMQQWYYIELDVTLAATPSGENWSVLATICKVYVDGLLVIDEVNVGPTYNAFGNIPVNVWNRVGQGGHAGVLDDYYILDGSGPAPWNAPLGDVQIDVIRPNGVGSVTQWTPTGLAANWGCVRDLTPDDDTTKVTAAMAGLSDLYQMENVNTNNGIIGAQILVSSRRTEEGFASLTPLLRHAGTTTELVTRSISPSYFYRNRDCFVTMPNGDPLTDANVNALQAGVKRSL